VALADYRAEAVKLGLGRLAALHHRSSASYQIHKSDSVSVFLRRQCDRTPGEA
jgi:hypothetical protein